MRKPPPDHPHPERWSDHNPAGFGPATGGDVPAPRRPNYALWLFYLYFRPARFYREFVVEHLWFTTVVASLLFGMSRTINRLDTQFAGANPGSRALYASMSWGNYWLMVAAIGVFAAAIFFLLGGWWYRVRLLWSGVPDPDRILARRVYVYASTIHALPTVLVTAWDTARYPNPLSAVNGPFNAAHVLLVLAPFWSFVVSYIGVRTVFNAKGFRAALWFLILPTIIYGILAALLLAAVLLPSAPTYTLPPPSRWADGDASFIMPRHWTIDTSDPEYEPGICFDIDMPEDGLITVWVVDTEESPEEIIQFHADWVRQETPSSTSWSTFDSWGSRAGHGVEYVYTNDGETFTTRSFATVVPDGRTIIIHATCHADACADLQSSFDTFVATIKLSAGSAPPRSYNNAGMSFALPRGWTVDPEAPDYRPGERIDIDIPEDALMTIWIVDNGDDARTATRHQARTVRDNIPSITNSPPFARWGSRSGHGIDGVYESHEYKYSTRIFAYDLPDGRVVMVQATFPADEADALKTHLERVVDSITIESADPANADAE